MAEAAARIAETMKQCQTLEMLVLNRQLWNDLVVLVAYLLPSEEGTLSTALRTFNLKAKASIWP